MFSVTKALESAGHKVIPLALKLDRNRESPYSRYFLESPFGSHAAKLDEAKLSAIQKCKLAGRTLYCPTAKRKVSEIIEQEQIDVVYLLNICNYIGPSVIAGAKEMGVRVVMRLSDYNFVCASYHHERYGNICMECKKNILNAIRYKCVNGSVLQSLVRSAAIGLHKYSRIYRNVDAFVCPSNFMMDQLVDFELRRERIHVLPSFVKMEDCGISVKSGRYVLYLGRLSREKGIDILIKAWHLMGINAPQLRIIGSGPEEQALRQMASNYKLDNVEFKPFLEYEEVMEHLKACAFVIVPSVCHDNAPMAALEAMAMGKAIVASRVGGLPDQVQDGKTGLLVQAGDPESLANAMASLVRDPDRIAIMGKAARLSAQTHFSEKIHMEKLLKLFHG